MNTGQKISPFPEAMTFSEGAAEPIFKKCEEYGWDFLIRFKKGSIPSVFEEYEELKRYDGNEQKEKITLPDRKKVEVTYKYVNDIDYKGHIVNIAEYTEKTGTEEKRFIFITSTKIKKSNVREICEKGRKRWKIENEGFDIQKNHGYELEHNFSNDYNAQKNHYLLIQIAHMLSQLFENSEKVVKEYKMNLAEIHEKILMDFKIKVMDDEVYKQERCQIRFV